jgi:hypothetical protein
MLGQKGLSQVAGGKYLDSPTEPDLGDWASYTNVKRLTRSSALTRLANQLLNPLGRYGLGNFIDHVSTYIEREIPPPSQLNPTSLNIRADYSAPMQPHTRADSPSLPLLNRLVTTG